MNQSRPTSGAVVERLEHRALLAADLFALTPAASSADTVVQGGAVTLTYTLKNAGDSASLPSTTRVQVRQGTDGRGDVVFQRDVSEPALAVAATRDDTLSFTLPAGVRAGTYSVTLIVDVRKTGGQVRNTLNDESTGEPFQVVEASTRQPNLTPRDVRVSDAGVAAGETVTVRWTMANKGEGAAAATSTAVVLGTSPVTPPALGESPLLAETPVIAAGTRISQSTSFTVPAGTATGAYFIWVIADAATPAVLVQTGDDDDALPVRLNVVDTPVRLPNLAPSRVEIDDIEVDPGDRIGVKWLLTNNGEGDAPATTTSIRIGASTTVTSGAVPGVEAELLAVAAPALRARQTVTQRGTVTIPAGFFRGTYVLWVVADGVATPMLTETSTADNSAASRTLEVRPLSQDQPNLVPVDVRVARPTAWPGETVKVTFKIANTGGGLAPATTTDLRLGTSTTIVPGDTANLVTLQTPAIRHNSYLRFSATVTIPVGTPAGNYVIWAVSSGVAATDVPEESTADNARASNAVQVRDAVPGRADLVPEILSVMPTAVEPGGMVTVAYRIFNRGRRTAPASSTVLRLGESPTTIPTTSLQVIETPAIRPGDKVTMRIQVPIASTVTAGRYYLWVEVDGGDPANVAQITTAGDVVRSDEAIEIGLG